MATSAIQQSAFTGKTGLRQGNEFIRKAGNFGPSRFTMRRTVKSAPESIWSNRMQHPVLRFEVRLR
ncbi:hypothetical protein TSUD_254350 [Trifolium subterraneum]|uniref:Uncharacterized protein n=1 Tax=Trifolium subterraneum TaxID=3900 RepID=A0A2Z6NIW1_TRISU|nr:hypothetical protein TSUD_254350 [Trifolium subterraneum]